MSPYSVIGVAKNSCWGRDKRIKTPSASRGEEYGEGDTSPSPADYGVCGSVVSSRAGPGWSHGRKRVLEYIELT